MTKPKDYDEIIAKHNEKAAKKSPWDWRWLLILALVVHHTHESQEARRAHEASRGALRERQLQQRLHSSEASPTIEEDSRSTGNDWTTETSRHVTPSLSTGPPVSGTENGDLFGP